MLTPGAIVNGKYRIIRLLGDGGMGTVYEAEHTELHSRVALKFLHRDLNKASVLVQRFLQEARISANIRSPFVTRVTDVDSSPTDGAYLVMEFLEGEPLQARLDREHSLSVDTALDIAIQILAGLEAAHALGVVHRDLKPDNVFLANVESGVLVKLLDFGIAKLRRSAEANSNLTQPGSFMGTPEYMAPEQAFSAEKATEQSDIFSVGVLLYQMISGELPAEGLDPTALVGQYITNQPLRLNKRCPHVPDALATIVHQAISGDPDARPPSARALRLALVPFAQRLSRPGRIAAEPPDIRAATYGPSTASGTVPVPKTDMPRPQRVQQATGPATAAPRPAASAPITTAPGQTQVVSSTVPPESGPPPATQGAPRSNVAATAQMQQARQLTPTAEMLAHDPSAQKMEVKPAMQPNPPTQASAQGGGSSMKWLWAVLVLLLAGGGVAGYLLYLQQNDIGPPPPPPVAPPNTRIAEPVTAPSPVTVPATDPAPSPVGTPRAAAPAPKSATGTTVTAVGNTTSPAATAAPTGAATAVPTALPTGLPTTLPAGLPTAIPTTLPTALPTAIPTTLPTAIPTAPPPN